jgi:UDP-N-acetylmuramoylalanine--D-glutamate ligase
MTLHGRRVLVIGAGASGLAAARVLSDEGATVWISEQRAVDDIAALDALDGLDVEVHAGGHRPEHLDGAELVVASPGVAENSPILQWAAERGLPIWSELELGARLCDVPVIAVTGTNGKTTTTEMVAAMMRASGLSAIPCGNIGHPFSLAAREGHDALAVEVSSFQLRFHRTFRPRVSVLLNIAPDHLDWHGSFEEYRRTKARIFELQGAGDTHVGNRDDGEGVRISSTARCAVTWFGLGAPREGDVGYEDGELVALEGGERHFLGRPLSETSGFRADAAAATAAALAFGLDPDAVAEGIGSVAPLPHRGQVVAEVGSVRFIDDSKATNPHAALAALEGVDRAVLVAGGLAKGVDLSPLVAATPSLAGVVVLGEAAAEIAALFEGAVPVRKAGSIEEAAALGLELAPHKGTVILAPACASQDMFRDYRERGERFAAAAARLAESKPERERDGRG